MCRYDDNTNNKLIALRTNITASRTGTTRRLVLLIAVMKRKVLSSASVAGGRLNGDVQRVSTMSNFGRGGTNNCTSTRLPAGQ
jgi:hypothetical protein